MVASLVTLYKKLKFITDENVGWGPVDLPEIELQTTAYWLTAEDAAAGWRRDELDVALIGAGRAIQAVARSCSWSTRGTSGSCRRSARRTTRRRRSTCTRRCPAASGLSERLFARHDELVAGASDLIRACPCDAGCPACTGPRLEPGVDGKALALRLLAALDRRRARRDGERRMTVEPAGRRHARAAAREPAGDARPRAGGPPIGPDQPPARAPFAGRRSPALAARLARRARRGRRGGRRTACSCAGSSPRSSMPRGPRAPGPAPGPSAAGRAARVHRHGDDRASRRRRARSRSSSGSRAGRAIRSARPSSCCPTTPTSRRCSPRSPAGSRRTRGS